MDKTQQLLEQFYGRIPDDKDIYALANFVYEQTKKDTIQRIKEEIESLKYICEKNLELSNDDADRGEIYAFELILSFLDTIEKE